MKGRVLPRHGVLCVTAARGAHLVERGHPIPGLELEDVGANLLDNAGNVIALVGGAAKDVGQLPVFGVGARDDDFDENLVCRRRRDGGVDDFDLGS